jgi:spore coat protein U-like protein
VKRNLLTLAACACFQVADVSAAQCNVGAVTMNFGPYVGTQVNVAQNIRITCSATLPPPERVNYEVQLSPGLGNSFAQRRMQRSGLPVDTLPYNLYLGSVPAVLNTNVWGDGTGGTRVWQGSMNLSRGQPTRTDTNTIAAAVPAGTVPSTGAYGDAVTATIVFR